MTNHILIIAITCMIPISVQAQENKGDRYGDPIPAGAIMRLGTIRYRYPGYDKRLEFVPDTETILVGAPNHPLQLVDARNGKVLREISFEGAQRCAFDISADGQTIVTLSMRRQEQTRDYFIELTVWNRELEDQRVTAKWVDSIRDAVQSIAINQDGTRIAGGSRSGGVRIWDAKSGEELKNAPVVEQELQDLAFSPDGKKIAAASRRGVFVWKWSGEEKPVKLEGLQRGARSVAFSPNGKWLATGSDDTIGARLFDANTNQLIRRFLGSSSSYYPEGLSFDAESNRLIVPAYDVGVEVWDVATGSLVKRLSAKGLKMRDAAISSNGKIVASTTGGSTIQVWDFTSGKSISDKFVGHLDAPYEIAFTADGKTMISADMAGITHVWSLETGEALHARQQTGWVAALSVSPDGKYDVSSGHDETIRVWETKSNRLVYKLFGHGRLGGKYKLAFALDGKTFASFGPDMYLRTWDMRTGKALTDEPIRVDGMKIRLDDYGEVDLSDDEPFLEGAMDVSRRCQFTQNAKRLLVPFGNGLNIFDVASAQLVKKLPNSIEPSGEFAIAPSGNRLGTASGSEFRIIDLTTGKTLVERELAGTSLRMPRFSPDGRMFSMIEYHRELKTRNTVVCEVETGNEYARIPGASNETTFTPDGRRMATGLTDSTIVIWDLENFRDGK